MIKNKNGFTLIEVVIAIAIIGIIAVMFISRFTDSVTGIYNARERSEALFSNNQIMEVITSDLRGRDEEFALNRLKNIEEYLQNSRDMEVIKINSKNESEILGLGNGQYIYIEENMSNNGDNINFRISIFKVINGNLYTLNHLLALDWVD